MLTQCDMTSQMWQRIRAARRHAGLTQQKLADLLVISKAAVAQWEASNPEQRTTPTTNNLRAVSQKTGAPFEWLADDAGDLIPAWMLESIDPRNAEQQQRLRDDLLNGGPPTEKEVPDLAALLDGLADRLVKADQRTRDAVGELLMRYAQAPEEGARLVKAIQALLEPDV